MKRLTACAFILLSFLGCKHSGPHYLLRLKYNKGVQTDLEYHTYIVTDDEPNDPIRNEVVRMGFKVDSVMRDSLFVMSAKVDYIRLVEQREFALETFSFDTEAPPMGQDRHAQLYNLLIKPMVDSALKLTISNKGVLVKPFAFSHGRPLPGLGPLNYELCQIHFPKDSVAIGEEWTYEQSLPLGKGRWASHYYIEGISDSTVNIKVYGDIRQGNKLNKFTGYYAIEQKTGALISGKMEVEGMIMFQGKGKLVINITSREWGFQ